VFVIRLHDGEEIRGSENDDLRVNDNTGVLSVHRVDGFDEVTTHYSPWAWAWVTDRVNEHGVRRPHTVANNRQWISRAVTATARSRPRGSSAQPR
jgi:hypothetical protein